MAVELIVVVVMVTLHSRLFERPVHAFHLAIRPGVVGLGQAMVDAVASAGAIKGMSA